MSTVEELTELLEKANETIMAISIRLASLEDGPYTYATVINHTGAGRLRISASGGIVEIEVPITRKDASALAKKGATEKWDFEKLSVERNKLQTKLIKTYKPATRFLMSKNGAAVDIAEPFDLPGTTALVKRVLSDGMVELGGSEITGSSRILLPLSAVGPIAIGDQIVHDQGSNVILRNLGKPVPNTPFRLEHDLGVTWDDIGGLDPVREFFWEVFILPSQNPEMYEKYGYKPPAGALLAGPPGNGKTLIAKAVATDVAKARGVEKSGFFSVKGPEILSQWVGAAEAAIRELFTTARKHSIEYGVPSVVFIDEAESVMNRRGSGRSSDVDRTIVPAFLTEMDGMNQGGGQVFVLLATNRPDLLDPAIVREGRIDKKVLIPRPSLSAAKHIFQVHLRRVPITPALTREEIAEMGTSYLWENKHMLAEVRCAKNEVKPFLLHNVLSGAMIASIVQTGSAIALRRDLHSKSFSGVKIEDILAAIDEIAAQNRMVSHDDSVKEFCESFKDDVIEVVRIR